MAAKRVFWTLKPKPKSPNLKPLSKELPRPPKNPQEQLKPAPLNVPLGHPKYNLLETMRPITEVLWGVLEDPVSVIPVSTFDEKY